MNVKPNTANAKPVEELRSGVVRAKDMPWQKMRFPGCEMKTLLFDPKVGETRPMRSKEEAHDYRYFPDPDLLTYVLEGSLVDKEGPDAGVEVGPGEFVWRPAGSRHSAWTPKGGLFIAMFQIPNKFFEKDGRVLDGSGKEWDPAWAHLLPA